MFFYGPFLHCYRPCTAQQPFASRIGVAQLFLPAHRIVAIAHLVAVDFVGIRALSRASVIRRRQRQLIALDAVRA